MFTRKSIIHFVLVSLMIFIGSSCATRKVPKLQQKVSVAAIKKDISKVERKLFRMHPDIDLYISKSALRSAFDSLRTSITEPLTPKEIYVRLAPVVASIRQGHTTVVPMPKPSSFANKKRLSTAIQPLQQMVIKEENNRYYIVADRTKDTSLILGAEIIKINNSTPQDIADSSRGMYVGDGFNESFYTQSKSNSLGDMYNRLYGLTEKIELTMKVNDSVFTQTLQSYSSKIINNRNKTFKINIEKRIRDTKKDSTLTEEIIAQQVDSLELLIKPAGVWKYGWNVKQAHYSKELRLVENRTAILTIRDFYTESAVLYRHSYNQIFQTLKDSGIQQLILDLRNNPGGSIAEIEELHGYITNRDTYYTNQPSMRVTSPFKIPFWMMGNTSIYTMPIVLPIIMYRSIDYLENTRLRKGGVHDYYNKHGDMKLKSDKAFDGQMYLVTNGATFSAASIIAANFKSENRGLVIGAETGGTYNGTVAGQMPMIPLYRVGLNVRIGTMNIIPEMPWGDHGRGVMPDYPFKSTVAELLNGIDGEIELLKRYIAAESQSESATITAQEP